MHKSKTLDPPTHRIKFTFWLLLLSGQALLLELPQQLVIAQPEFVLPSSPGDSPEQTPDIQKQFQDPASPSTSRNSSSITVVSASSGFSNALAYQADSNFTLTAPVKEEGEDLPPPKSSSARTGMQYQPLVTMTFNTAPSAGELPKDDSAQWFQAPTAESQIWCSTSHRPTLDVYWRSWAMAYRPLYFEDITLERYGHHCRCLQPIISGIKFYAQVPFLPYKLTAKPPCELTYNSGHFRPGCRVSPHRYRCRKSWRAALVQGAVVTGMVFLIP